MSLTRFFTGHVGSSRIRSEHLRRPAMVTESSSVWVIPLLFAVCCQGFPQGHEGGLIRGLVRDSLSGQPLEHVNVFLASTTMGTGTRSNGSFALPKVPPGAYDLVLSCVGYELKRLHVELTGPDTLSYKVRLRVRIIPVEGVEVAGNARQWKERLDHFLNVFLGDSRNAERCRLVNPEVLGFKADTALRMLYATADRALIVENRALGYRVRIELEQFQWNVEREYGTFVVYTRFDPLQGPNAAQRAQWQETREVTYRSSMRRFLAALVSGTLEEERFRLYAGSLEDLQVRLGKRLTPDQLAVEQVAGTPFFRWAHEGWLRVEQENPEGPATSYIRLAEPVVFMSARGILRDPLSIGVLGYWKGCRIADLLPDDYVP